MNFILKIFLLLVFFFTLSFAQNNDYKLEKIASNLNIPWGMTFLNSKELLITSRNGTITLLNTNTKKLTNITNTPNVLYDGQGGLLDIAISPNFIQDSWIYFTYSKSINNQGLTTLARAKLKVNRLYSWEELLITKSSSNTSVHFGSRITFDENNHVFFSIGDRGVRKNAQNLTNHAGSIIRLNLDGSIPKDNPFLKNKNILDEIYTYGHRNPQGLFYDKNTQRLWSIEHGPRGGDEINLIEESKNYGWPVISYGKEYWAPISIGEGTSKEGMAEPIKVYVPSIAPSSLIVYSGKLFKSWKGNLFSGALKLTHLNRIVLDENNKVIKEERLLKKLGQRIRNVIESPQGWLYISTDSGNIYRLKPLNKKD